ncbi:AMP-binding protein [Conexibacter woesei]|uniref:AMP-dependent synthetase and ligase n=1 Tax=Conexibacter woesei (strain DSM 14684 / CCUG 47730 / CIP 108061 / JCM 11494 / NBRC 100937 / ID131577) TaxID=469383 RepID=D3F4B4_CONWI|nr:AMP-binding protein [Conexibacter woesei]ADB50486.1 AMP-dependent synthetase and ligase [Conexibacter woesei DSM 14684]
MPATVEDRALPAREECVLPLVLERRAAREPDRVFAACEDGTTWTYAETQRQVSRTARALRAAGVRAGDVVLSWQPNGLDALRTWLAINRLGAVYAPLNVAYRGLVLAHVIENAGARLMIAHADLVPLLDAIETAQLERVLTVDQLDAAGEQAAADGSEELDACPGEPWDTYGILYTSGTTGPSKGVLCSYAHLWSTSTAAVAGTLDHTDRYMVNLPLFHGGGTIGVAVALILGGSISLVEGFRTATFWDVVRRTETTAMTLLGVMASFLNAQPPSAEDRRHPLRRVFMIPLSEDPHAFTERFGVAVHTLYNMTETSVPLIAAAPSPPLGSCGRPRPGVDIRLVDDRDREVAPGEVGELIVRTDRPWAMTHGYNGMDEATAAAWRNGWFHTGDAFRQDADGDYYFVDRIKDAMRRRGENISSFEVEAAVLAHPGVREAAAVAVASEHGEDEVLIVVSPAPHATVDPAALLDHCIEALPHFMVPRYVRVVEELPKTPTNKVRKHVLREEGLAPGTWDRAAHGIEVRGIRLASRRRGS